MGIEAEPEYDVVVVGGGIAGLSAALVLARARRKVAVVDSGQPRNAPASHVQGYLTRDGVPPAELVRLARQEVHGYGVELISGTVIAAQSGQVTLSGGRTLTTRHIVLAMGLHDVLPDLEGAKERWGRDLLQCPYCHGWEVRDRKLAVLGTGETSIQQALLIRQLSSDTTLLLHSIEALNDSDAEALAARGVAVVPGKVRTLVTENDALVQVKLEGGQLVDCEALFFEPQSTVDAGVVESLGCGTGDDGCIPTDDDGRTSIRRVWAVGNTTDPASLVISAAGDAYRVAVALNAELVQEDVAQAVAAARSQERSLR